MGRRPRKKVLLVEIAEQRAALDDCLTLVPSRLKTTAGVTRGGWSLKGILGHLVEWPQMNLDWFAAGIR